MKNKSSLLLASASPRRVELLAQAGLTPDIVRACDIDETPLDRELPQMLAVRLARQKAEAAHEDGHFILAADTVVACGRRALPKAECHDDLLSCIAMLSGRRHRVYGGIAIRTPDGRTLTRLVTTMVQFKALSQDEKDFYVDSGEGIGKAGGYAIQGLAACHIKSISGSYSNIVGLSIYDTVQMLKGAGFFGHHH